MSKVKGKDETYSSIHRHTLHQPSPNPTPDSKQGSVQIVSKVFKSKLSHSKLLTQTDSRLTFDPVSSRKHLNSSPSNPKILSPVRQQIAQHVNTDRKPHEPPFKPLTTYNSYLSQLKSVSDQPTGDLNMSINLNLLQKKSFVFNGRELFFIRDYESLKFLYKQISSWLVNNSDVGNEIDFVEKEREQIGGMEGLEVRHAYLVFCVYKRCYCPVNITLYGGMVRLARQKDYHTVQDVCQYIFDTMRAFSPEVQGDMYREFINSWERDEYEQEGIMMNWTGRDSLEDHRRETNDKEEVYKDNQQLRDTNRALEKELDLYKNRCDKLAGLLNKNYSSNWGQLTSNFLSGKVDGGSPVVSPGKAKVGAFSPMRKVDTFKIGGESPGWSKQMQLAVESPTAKLWQRAKGFELESPTHARLNTMRAENFNLGKNSNNVSVLKLDLDLILVEMKLLNKRVVEVMELELLAPEVAAQRKAENAANTLAQAVMAIKLPFNVGGVTVSDSAKKPGSSYLSDSAQKKQGSASVIKKDNFFESGDWILPLIHSWLEKCETMHTEINVVQEELKLYADKLIFDVATEWNEKVYDFQSRLQKLRIGYRRIVKGPDQDSWMQEFKDQILEEANHSKDFIEFIEAKFWDYLGIQNFAIEYVENYAMTYTLQMTKNADCFQLNYTGCLVDGLREGYGILKHQSSGEKFFQGRFKKGLVFGNSLTLWYKEGSPICDLNLADKQGQATATGPVKLYHYSGQLAVKGKVKDGLLDGVCSEYHTNGKLRYRGPFQEGGYHGKGLEIYHNYPQNSDENALMFVGDFEKGKLVGKVQDFYLRETIPPTGNTYSILENANFTANNLNSQQKSSDEIVHRSPVHDIYYSGKYKNGLKHGQGEIKCIDSGIVIFGGQWKDGLPMRNDGSNDDSKVTFYHRIFGNKIFEGSVNRRPDGKLGGKCKLYYYLNGQDMLYEGMWSAPALSCVLFCTWDLELEGFRDFIPKFQSEFFYLWRRLET